MTFERPPDVPTVAQAMAACIEKTSHMLNGPPDVFEMGPYGIMRVRKDLTPAECEAAREWATHDQTPGVLTAWEKLGEAVAWEENQRFWNAFLGT